MEIVWLARQPCLPLFAQPLPPPPYTCLLLVKCNWRSSSSSTANFHSFALRTTLFYTNIIIIYYYSSTIPLSVCQTPPTNQPTTYERDTPSTVNFSISRSSSPSSSSTHTHGAFLNHPLNICPEMDIINTVIT